VAPDLLGRVLVRRLPGGSRLAAKIVETEAYEEGDPASHSFRGRRTSRNALMFGRPGLLYVYFTYGMHFCANVVAGATGEGCAVLLRAAQPIEGLSAMEKRRSTDNPRLLCSGPGRLTQAFGLDARSNGRDLVSEGSAIFIACGAPARDFKIKSGPRIGISDGLDRDWRFVIAGNAFASRP
jgi:DNA-3-methyladenine glycosylase